ncbi:MAG TPA: glycosyltransferase family 25 protein [Caulobacteraceae bacterium]|jgi:GR25 family glycosyltransferase involved in LPS biosynthesis
MDAFYINLEARFDRRAAIEAAFVAHAPPAWRLTRFAAIEGADPPGSLSLAEKSCFLSHRRLIESRLGVTEPTLMLEDDSTFGPHSFPAIDSQLGRTGEAQWDVIFTDLCVPEIMPMAQLYRLRRRLTRGGALATSLVELQRMNFAGASGYLINPRSCARLCELFLEAPELNVPFDLFLRNHIQNGRLKGLAIFPFPTTLSPLADRSSIQTHEGQNTDRIWNLFRRAVWLDRDLGALQGPFADLRAANSDPDAEMIATIFTAMLADDFRIK